MKIENFSCKNCGGMTVFDPKSQNLKCENCGTEVQIQKIHTLERHSLYDYENRLKDTKEEKVTMIDCSSCGAKIELGIKQASSKCPYCSSNIVVAEKLISALEPDGLRPFVIDKKEVDSIFSKWIKGRWFAPNKLKNLHQKGKIMGIYIPYWSFDNSAYCEYVAEGGIDRVIHYEEDGKTRTRVETDWYFVRGSVGNRFSDVIISATNSLERNLLRNLGGFYVKNTLKFDSGYLAGYGSEIFKIPMQQGYQEAKSVMTYEMQNLVSRDVLRRYDRVRGIRMDIDWSDEYYRLLMLPVYSTSYSYERKVYQVVINGENGEITGEYPKSIIKIAFAIFVAIIFAMMLFYLFSEGY